MSSLVDEQSDPVQVADESDPGAVGSTDLRRGRRTWPITLSVLLMSMNVVLMVCWIVLLARMGEWSALTIGTLAFAFVLVVLSVYLVLTIKEVRLNQRQVNFVDSVTHELKSPIASLKLYLETLQLRSLEDSKRVQFYEVMSKELMRLDELINHLLEVARLEAIGEDTEPEDVQLAPLLERCAESACRHHDLQAGDVVRFDVEPVIVHGRRLVLEMVFRNLLDNALKYSDDAPSVEVEVRLRDRKRVVVEVKDRGVGVPVDIRKRIFGIFYRGGKELERTQKGTGLGLYIVRTLLRLLKGRVSVRDREDGHGSVFRVELPGRTAG